MGRSPCCSKEQGLNRGAWTAMEDKILTDYIKNYGEGKWRNIPKKAGLNRCGKSCRLRWLNYLRPDIKRGNITDDEEELIIRLHKLLGNRWSLIAGRLPGRTDNEIKNYWNTIIGKKIQSTTRPALTPTRKSCRQTQQTINQYRPSSPAEQPNLNTEPPPPRPVDQTDIKPSITTVPGPYLALDDNNVKPAEPLSPVIMSSEQNASNNFILDFEMEQDFLSDFLNAAADFSSELGGGSNDTNNNNNNNKSQISYSPNSDHETVVTPLLFDNQKYDTDFRSMASSFLGTELEYWLHQETNISNSN